MVQHNIRVRYICGMIGMKNLSLVPRQTFVALSTLCFRNVKYKTNKAVASYCLARNYSKQEDFPPQKHEIKNGSSTISSESVQNDDLGVSSKQEHADHDQESTLKSNILNASLPYVNRYGWTTEAIAKGAESLGYSKMVNGMFKNGATDLVNFFYASCNSKLEEKLKDLVKAAEQSKEKQSTSNFMKVAIELRLRMNGEFIDSWPQALALHMSPTNAINALDNIGSLMDIIWFYAGDRSSDFNWYTKRLILGAVYKGTELCMIQDKSEDFQETWSFLDRRLSDVTASANCFRQAANAGKDLGTVGQAGFITVLNILGLNSKSR